MCAALDTVWVHSLMFLRHNTFLKCKLLQNQRNGIGYLVVRILPTWVPDPMRLYRMSTWKNQSGWSWRKVYDRSRQLEEGSWIPKIPKEELNSKIAETKFHRIEAVDGVIMNNSHDIMHSVVKHTLARSRKWVWIIKGKRLSETVVKNCNYCKLERSSS